MAFPTPVRTIYRSGGTAWRLPLARRIPRPMMSDMTSAGAKTADREIKVVDGKTLRRIRSSRDTFLLCRRCVSVARESGVRLEHWEPLHITCGRPGRKMPKADQLGATSVLKE